MKAVWTVLSTAIDPELGADIVTPGLVYDVAVEGVSARITHTLFRDNPATVEHSNSFKYYHAEHHATRSERYGQ